MNAELNPWIELIIPVRSQFTGIDELKKDLEKVGSVHIRTRWYAACGPDLGVIAILKFGVDAVASGFVWDAIKSLLKRTVESLNKIITKNKDAYFTATVGMRVEYDDMTIVFSELSGTDLAHVSKFMNDLPEHLDFLKKHNINNIDEILLFGPDISSNKAMNTSYWGRWEITYDFGMNSVSYDSIHKKLINN